MRGQKDKYHRHFRSSDSSVLLRPMHSVCSVAFRPADSNEIMEAQSAHEKRQRFDIKWRDTGVSFCYFGIQFVSLLFNLMCSRPIVVVIYIYSWTDLTRRLRFKSTFGRSLVQLTVDEALHSGCFVPGTIDSEQPGAAWPNEMMDQGDQDITVGEYSGRLFCLLVVDSKRHCF